MDVLCASVILVSRVMDTTVQVRMRNIDHCSLIWTTELTGYTQLDTNSPNSRYVEFINLLNLSSF